MRNWEEGDIKMNIPSDFQEFIFLSECYEQKITEEVVYKLFIEKVISDYAFSQYPYDIRISQFHDYIIKTYGIEIPPTFIDSIIRTIDDYNVDFRISKGVISFFQCPSNLKEKYKITQQKNNDDTLRIYNKFNEYLKTNNLEIISKKEFEDTFSIFYSRLTNIEPKKETEFSKILVEWINLIYKNSNMSELSTILDKFIYSWLLYSYFYSVKRQNKKLNNNIVIFDTNLIVYLLGVNGKEKQFFVEYLINKLKSNNCSILINHFTITELINLMNKSDGLDISIFRKENPEIIRQINQNINEFLKNRIEKQYEIPLIIDAKNYSLNTEESKDLIAKLKQFKHSDASYESIEHDIQLLYSAGEIKKINNIYSEKRLIATSDYVFEYWLRMYKKRKYKSEITVLLPLDKINLIFWIESDKCLSSNFLRNTWMSVSDSIQFFKNHKINNLLSAISEKYNQGNLPPENWRSVYILLKESLPFDDPNKDLSNEDIAKALQKIAQRDTEENYELLQQVNQLKEDVKRLSDKSSQPVIIQTNPKNKADDFTLLELVIALIKKIASLIFRQK